MRLRTVIRLLIISIVFVLSLVYGIKAAAEKEAAGAPSIVIPAPAK